MGVLKIRLLFKTKPVGKKRKSRYVKKYPYTDCDTFSVGALGMGPDKWLPEGFRIQIFCQQIIFLCLCQFCYSLPWVFEGIQAEYVSFLFSP